MENCKFRPAPPSLGVVIKAADVDARIARPRREVSAGNYLHAIDQNGRRPSNRTGPGRPAGYRLHR